MKSRGRIDLVFSHRLSEFQNVSDQTNLLFPKLGTDSAILPAVPAHPDRSHALTRGRKTLESDRSGIHSSSGVFVLAISSEIAEAQN